MKNMREGYDCIKRCQQKRRELSKAKGHAHSEHLLVIDRAIGQMQAFMIVWELFGPGSPEYEEAAKNLLGFDNVMKRVEDELKTMQRKEKDEQQKPTGTDVQGQAGSQDRRETQG